MGRNNSIKVQPNQKFGKWLTIKFYSKNETLQTQDMARWLCVCDCGKEKYVRTADLLGKLSTMCKHCSMLMNTAGNILPEKGAAWNKIFGIIKRSAKVRDLEFKLTEEQIRKLVLDKCFYCDSSASNIAKSSKGDEIPYNGIDRVDNTKGYLIENCVTCCQKCNFMKTNYELKRLIEHIEKIIKNKAKILERSETIPEMGVHSSEWKEKAS